MHVSASNLQQKIYLKIKIQKIINEVIYCTKKKYNKKHVILNFDKVKSVKSV